MTLDRMKELDELSEAMNAINSARRLVARAKRRLDRNHFEIALAKEDLKAALYRLSFRESSRTLD